jgi:hypothetical protein
MGKSNVRRKGVRGRRIYEWEARAFRIVNVF